MNTAKAQPLNSHTVNNRAELTDFPLACPLDGLPLQRCEHGFNCTNKHNYDVSRHGYVNLLPVQFKPSNNPGDTRAMVEARRSVLDHKLFREFADTFTQTVCLHAIAIDTDSLFLIDAGCGEGYYSNLLQARLHDAKPDTSSIVMGVDISKHAVTAAAKKYYNVAWIVANNKRLPVLRGSCSVISSLFGFESWEPWAQLQTTGQLVVTARAGPRHLYELRELIYDTVTVHDAADDSEAIGNGYGQIHQERVIYKHSIDSTELCDNILAMTPHGFRTNSNAGDSLQLDEISTMTIDIVVRVYRRS